MTPNGFRRIADRVQEHINSLPDTTDIILIILKGHLLIEEEMNRMIEIVFQKPQHILKKNFSFYKKLCVLRAKNTQTGNCRGLWDIIETINNIRNNIAHHLSPRDLSSKLGQLFRKIENSNSEYRSYVDPSWDEARHVREDLGYVVAVVAGLSDRLSESN